MEPKIPIEVACASPDRQWLIALKVPADCTVQQAILQSRILDHFPDTDLSTNPVGIFGQVVALTHPLNSGDRIEIYRPLKQDPKQARRRRAR